jgi:putative ABC transport system substrate-binding protein
VDSLSRRQFVQGLSVAGLGLLAGCGRQPLEAPMPTPAKVPVVGYLTRSTPGSTPYLEALRQGLQELGYVDGQNIIIEARGADGSDEQLLASAKELAHRPVDIMVTWGTVATLAAKATTSAIPIVMVSVGDPVQTRLVANLSRPGDNITGLTNTTRQLNRMRIELLRDAVPEATRVAVIWNPANPANLVYFREVEVTAQALGMRLQSLEVQSVADFERVFARATRGRADALLVAADATIADRSMGVVDFATTNRQPALYPARRFVDLGGLMALGPNLPELSRRSALYVDKILRGAKPANLSVEQPQEFELTINLRAAETIGIALPQSVLVRAMEIIQ